MERHHEKKKSPVRKRADERKERGGGLGTRLEHEVVDEVDEVEDLVGGGTVHDAITLLVEVLILELEPHLRPEGRRGRWG